MDKKVLKESNEAIRARFDDKEVKKLFKKFEKIWSDKDDDKTVIAKARAWRADQMAKVRFHLRALEAATFDRLDKK